MKLLTHFRNVVAVTLLVMAAMDARAQVSPAPANSNHNLNPNLNPPLPPPLPPLPPPIQYKTVAPGVTLRQTSPILYFRGILGMTPTERERALAKKPDDSKKILLAKVEEYLALPADIRETRLRQTQLRWELTTLNNLAPADRPAFIKEAALEDRSLLEDYARWMTNSPAGRKEMLEKLSTERHTALATALAQWDAVPEPERLHRSADFGQFFEENQAQQQKTLDAFTDTERRTMETALKQFAGLPEAQRKNCIHSFEEFASMDAAQRDEFLKNAARWETMTLKERDVWRALVQKYPIMPPPPPGFRPVPTPPLPPGMILPPPLPPGMSPPSLSTASIRPAAHPPATNTAQ
jgi:hypothetical protein